MIEEGTSRNVHDFWHLLKSHFWKLVNNFNKSLVGFLVCVFDRMQLIRKNRGSQGFQGHLRHGIMNQAHTTHCFFRSPNTEHFITRPHMLRCVACFIVSLSFLKVSLQKMISCWHRWASHTSVNCVAILDSHLVGGFKLNLERGVWFTFLFP